MMHMIAFACARHWHNGAAATAMRYTPDGGSMAGVARAHEALPLDEHERALLALLAQVDLLQRAREQARLPATRHWQRRLEARRRRRYPVPLVAVVDPRALVLVVVVKDDVHAAARGADAHRQ